MRFYPVGATLKGGFSILPLQAPHHGHFEHQNLNFHIALKKN